MLNSKEAKRSSHTLAHALARRPHSEASEIVHAALPTTAIDRADLELCKGFIKEHSKSFYFSSLLLPRQRRAEAWALYAFCRQADDSVDGTNTGDGALPPDAPGETAGMLRRVEMLRRRLSAVYAEEPGPGENHAIDRAFLSVIRRTGLPRGVPAKLIDGMEMDARGVTYGTWDELYTYCFNVAATVGLMMTYVLGHRMPPERRTEVMLRACDLGVAMQLTNIARDVCEDGRRGRVYLPDELLYRFGLHSDAVLELCAQAERSSQSGGKGPRPAPPPLRRAVLELLTRADQHYAAARAGIPMLKEGAWLSIASAERIYRGIGEKLAAANYDPLAGRVYVSLAGKLWRMGLAFASTLLPSQRRIPAQSTTGPADEILLRQCQEAGVV
jgi:phytoene synthase